MTWHPESWHARWQRSLMNTMTTGGTWTLPSYGLTFTKIDENTLKLAKERFTPLIPELAVCEPDEMVRRVIETCKKAGIEVIRE